MRPIRKREDEPKVTCPVCQAEEKASRFMPGIEMCTTCWQCLAPDVGGTDHGLFMVRTETRDNGLRRAFLRPRGFWSDAIEVGETEDYFASYEAKKTVIKQSVSWSTGGTDGTVDEIRAAENFARAMDHAVMLAKTWKMERQG